MCHLRSSLKKYLADSKTDQFVWKPHTIPRCTKKNCPESATIRKKIAQFMVENTLPIIDPDTCLPVVEEKNQQDFEKFSELNKISTSRRISHDEKLRLISVPDFETVELFVRKVMHYCVVAPEVIIHAQILLCRFLQKTGWKLRSTNWRPLLLISIRIAQKYEECSVLVVKDLTLIYGLLDPEEYLDLESRFLQLLDYDCFIKYEQFFRRLRCLK